MLQIIAMKKIFLLFIILIFIFSCKKKDEEEYKDIFGEIIYTDSFSPDEWEHPAARKRIEAVDKDIGKFIKQDIMEPKLRKILKVIEKLIDNIQKNEIKKIQNLLTPSAYNSFTLRFPKITFEEDYILRVAYPEFMNGQSTQKSGGNKTKNTGQNKFWVQFKLLFPTSSLLGKVEIEFFGDDCKITDFENQFFTDINEMFKSDNPKTED